MPGFFYGLVFYGLVINLPLPPESKPSPQALKLEFCHKGQKTHVAIAS